MQCFFRKVSKIKLYQFEHCPFCEKVRKKLAELGLEYEKIEVDRTNKPKQVLDTGGTVPVIDIDGEIISDSSQIVEELEKRFNS